MKKILITLTLGLFMFSANAQDSDKRLSDYKKRLQERLKESDSVFKETHQKEIIELEYSVNSKLQELQKILDKMKVDYKIKKVVYRKED